MSKEKDSLGHLHFIATKQCPCPNLLDGDRKVLGKALAILDVLNEIYDIEICIKYGTHYLHLTKKNTQFEYYIVISEEQYNKILEGI